MTEAVSSEKLPNLRQNSPNSMTNSDNNNINNNMIAKNNPSKIATNLPIAQNGDTAPTGCKSIVVTPNSRKNAMD